MARLEIFVSGVFGKTGEDAYQIGSKNADGEYVAASGDDFSFFYTIVICSNC